MIVFVAAMRVAAAMPSVEADESGTLALAGDSVVVKIGVQDPTAVATAATVSTAVSTVTAAYEDRISTMQAQLDSLTAYVREPDGLQDEIGASIAGNISDLRMSLAGQYVSQLDAAEQ